MVDDGAQVWTLVQDGVAHRVEASGSTTHNVKWYVDGELVAEKRAWEEKMHLAVEGGRAEGRLLVRFSTLGHGRRATLHTVDEQAEALAGVGGVDLVPEPGSPAAAYEDKVRLHPTRYAAIAIANGVAKVVVPLLLGLLAVRFAISIDWPDLPFPDLPDVSLPGWLRQVLDKAKYLIPILLAFAIARAEIRRRRTQDELRRKAAQPATDDGDPSESL